MRLLMPSNDTDISISRIDGNGRAPVIGFLPWTTPFRLAAAMSLVPRDYIACYELPSGIVSSEPEVGVEACRRLVEDAIATIVRARVRPSRVSVVGLSLGNGPATYLANRLGARLTSIASGDRGDLLLWQSPGSRHIKEKAIRKGYSLSDFTEAMRGYHPVENLTDLASGSSFVFGTRDELIPKTRRDGLLDALRSGAHAPDISFLDARHAGTLVQGALRLVSAQSMANATTAEHYTSIWKTPCDDPQLA